MNHRIFLLGTTITALFMFSLIVGVSRNAIAEAEYHELLATVSHSLTTEAIVMNAMCTLAMFFVRLMYISAHSKKQRRRSRKSGERHASTGMRSVHFRSVLKWRDVAGSESSNVMVAPRIRMVTVGSSDSNLSTCSSTTGSSSDHLQLTPVGNTALYESTATMASWAAAYILRPSTRKQSRLIVILLSSTAVVGTVGTTVSLATIRPTEHSDTLSMVALVSTLVYASVVFACYQRQLLRQLAATFNFIFLSVQISLAHLCLCDIFYWQQHKTLGVVACWVWMHVVLTVDALTPVMKARLGFRVVFMVPVVVMALVGQVLLAVELVWREEWKLRNRVVWDVQLSSGQRVVFHSFSILLGRFVTLIVWFLWLLYRICRQSSEDELVLLQGAVEYDYTAWKKRRVAAVIDG